MRQSRSYFSRKMRNVLCVIAPKSTWVTKAIINKCSGKAQRIVDSSGHNTIDGSYEISLLETGTGHRVSFLSSSPVFRLTVLIKWTVSNSARLKVHMFCTAMLFVRGDEMQLWGGTAAVRLLSNSSSWWKLHSLEIKPAGYHFCNTTLVVPSFVTRTKAMDYQYRYSVPGSAAYVLQM